MGSFLLSCLRTSHRHGVMLEGNFATLCVGTLVYEGVGRQLYPDIDLLAQAAPYFARQPLKRETRLAVARKLLKEKLGLWN